MVVGGRRRGARMPSRGECAATRNPPLVLSGPSGVGKTTVAETLAGTYPERFRRVVTATTRPPRAGEADGVDYMFMSARDFEDALREGRFAEHAAVHGYMYGTPADQLADPADMRVPVVVLDPAGAAAVRTAVPGTVRIYLREPSVGELRRRLERRGDDAGSVSRRMADYGAYEGARPAYDDEVVSRGAPAAVAAAVAAAYRSVLARRGGARDGTAACQDREGLYVTTAGDGSVCVVGAQHHTDGGVEYSLFTRAPDGYAYSDGGLYWPYGDDGRAWDEALAGGCTVSGCLDDVVCQGAAARAILVADGGCYGAVGSWDELLEEMRADGLSPEELIARAETDSRAPATDDAR